MKNLKILWSMIDDSTSSPSEKEVLGHYKLGRTELATRDLCDLNRQKYSVIKNTLLTRLKKEVTARGKNDGIILPIKYPMTEQQALKILFKLNEMTSLTGGSAQTQSRAKLIKII